MPGWYFSLPWKMLAQHCSHVGHPCVLPLAPRDSSAGGTSAGMSPAVVCQESFHRGMTRQQSLCWWHLGRADYWQNRQEESAITACLLHTAAASRDAGSACKLRKRSFVSAGTVSLVSQDLSCMRSKPDSRDNHVAREDFLFWVMCVRTRLVHDEQEELSMWIAISNRSMRPSPSIWGPSWLSYHTFWDSQEQVHIAGNTGIVISPPTTLMPAWWPAITPSQWQMWWCTPRRPHHGGPALPTLQPCHSHWVAFATSEFII